MNKIISTILLGALALNSKAQETKKKFELNALDTMTIINHGHKVPLFKVLSQRAIVFPDQPQPMLQTTSPSGMTVVTPPAPKLHKSKDAVQVKTYQSRVDTNLTVALVGEDTKGDGNIRNADITAKRVDYSKKNLEVSANLVKFKNTGTEINYSYDTYNVEPDLHMVSGNIQASEEIWNKFLNDAIYQPDKFIQTVKAKSVNKVQFQ